MTVAVIGIDGAAVNSDFRHADREHTVGVALGIGHDGRIVQHDLRVRADGQDRRSDTVLVGVLSVTSASVA